MKTLNKTIKKIKFKKPFNSNMLTAFAAVFVVIGIVTLLSTFAAPAPNGKSAEGESSTTTLNTATAVDTTASGGSYLELKEATSTPPPIMGSGMIPLDQLPKGANGSSEILIQPSEQQGPSGDGSGNFRNFCFFSHMNYDDPIVYPGQQGKAHLHMFIGNKSSNYLTTSVNLRDPGNKSTCSGGAANLSSYWVPALLDNGRPLVPNDNGVSIYYKSGYRFVPAGSITEVPQGLKMIAGNKNALTGQSPDIVSWFCEGGTDTTTIPNCAPGKELTMSITFPQCWDGVNLDSTDHISHLRYPGTSLPTNQMPAGTLGDYGDGCSKETGYKTAIPAITINVHWDIPVGGSSNLRLSSDLPNALPGASAHADFMEGWNRTVEPIFVQNCIRKVLDCTRGLGNATTLVDPPN